MIQVQLFDPSYEYDIYALTKAFYPEEEITFTSAEEGIVICLPDKKESVIGNLPGEADKKTLVRAVYEALAARSGKTLPWGTLTGIRPTKIPMKLLSEGHDDASILTYMKDTYLVSDEKAALALKIAKLETEILSSLHGQDGFSIYVGIPFCPTTCMYCSFTSHPLGAYAKVVDEYLDALDKEMILSAKVFAGRVLDTVYIGGGTPTTLSPDQMKRLNEMLRKHFDFDSVREYTMEAGRPDSITDEKLLAMKEIGISRISVNPQTMHDETLRLIGRAHSVEQTVAAFYKAREHGFDNINTDLILGLPGEDEEMVTGTFEKIKTLDPDSVTVHSMALKRAAAMHTFLQEHPEIKSINTPEMMKAGEKYAQEMGLRPYYLYRQKNMAGNFENTGYAKDGKYGLYNVLIMEEVQPIAAIGAGTISKNVYENGLIERCSNIKDIKLYLSEFDRVIEKKEAFYKPYEKQEK